MEQAISGQIGQPAACMIENKVNLRADEKLCNYELRDWPVRRAWHLTAAVAQTPSKVSGFTLRVRESTERNVCDARYRARQMGFVTDQLQNKQRKENEIKTLNYALGPPIS